MDIKKITCEEPEFLNYLANSNLLDANVVLDFLSNYSLKEESKGSILYVPYNDNGDTLFFDIANLLPTDVNQEIMRAIGEELSKLSRIDYSKIDKMGMTFFKKVLRLQNLQLLSLFADKTIRYEPSLDDIYNNLSNEEVKKYAKTLDIIFPEIIAALKTPNWKEMGLSKRLRKQFRSPFYDRYKHCEQVIKLIPLALCDIALKDLYDYIGEEFLPKKIEAEYIIKAFTGCGYPPINSHYDYKFNGGIGNYDNDDNDDYYDYEEDYDNVNYNYGYYD